MRKTYIKQITQNSSGGIQLAVYLQDYLSENDINPVIRLHDVQIGPDDDWDERIAANNKAIESLGFPPMDSIMVEPYRISRNSWLEVSAVKDELSKWRAQDKVNKEIILAEFNKSIKLN